MKLQYKLTLILLTVSLITATTVGMVAYAFLMWDFRKSAGEQALTNFVSDITAYMDKYGSIENGEKQNPFHHFVLGRQLLSDTRPNEAMHLRGKIPPFRFTVLDPDGRVLTDGGGYRAGRMVPEHVLKQSRPIVVNGKTKLRVVQQGEPQLSPQDHDYLSVMRKALITGIVTSGSFTMLLGLFFGRRFTTPLRELIDAIGSMSLSSNLQREIPVRSKDEIGLLTNTFNRMNASLVKSHAQLKKSHEKIKKQTKALRELSIRDPLTHLFNRRHFDAHTEIMFNRAVRYQHAFSVMIGDLDHFKTINDRFSHTVGDEVLRTVSGLLLDNTRKSDLAARYGGEEFVMAFPDTSLEQAKQYCEKIRKIIEHYPWDTIHPDLEVTMSMGVCGDPSLGSVEKMISHADEQLYESKKRGRNRVMPVLLKAV